MRYTTIALVALLLLAGCGSSGSSGSTVEPDQAKFCTNLQAFQTSLDAVKNLGPNATVADAKAAAATAVADWNQVKESAWNELGPELYNVQAAVFSLSIAITQMPDNARLADAKQIINERKAAIDTAEEQLRTAAKCS